MSEEARLRELICILSKSLFDRGLTYGSSGNISARLSDGTLLITPTGSSLGFLDPAKISRLGEGDVLISGDAPTKEIPLHTAFYDTRAETKAVVHLHSTHATALSMLPDVDPDDALPHLTPYSLMRLGKVKLLPFFLPGAPEMGEAVRGLRGTRTAVLLANHGPVVAGGDIENTVYAMEELEETAKLALLVRNASAKPLDPSVVRRLLPPGQA